MGRRPGDAGRSLARAGRVVRLLVAGLLAAPTPARGDAPPAPSPSAACAEALPSLYQRVSPAVVSIAAMSSDPYDVDDHFSRVVGSGVVIDPSGLILTNSHVVFGRQVIDVTLDDGSTIAGRLVGADPLFDVAVIRIAPPPGHPLAAGSLGDSDTLKVGDDVFAIGNPFGLDQTLTRGIVSALNRLLPGVPLALTEPMIQTDAAINPGSSGGPLVDRCGTIVGITTAILPDAQNIGFAVPIDVVKRILGSLLEKGRVVRPWLGVQGQFVTASLKQLLRAPLVDGFLVEAVEPGSPAEKLGIQGGEHDLILDGQPVLLGGDIITRVNGSPVDGLDSLAAALQSLKVGATVRLTLFRDSRTLEMDCVLTERPLLPQDIPARRSVAPTSRAPGRRAPARRAF